MNNVIDTFLTLEQALTKSHPPSIAEARRLAEQMVDVTTSDSELAWSVLWNKPLFANTRVATAYMLV